MADMEHERLKQINQPMQEIEAMRPKEKYRVMDLVREAGLDISDWCNCNGSPAANPKYCFEWAFVEEDVAIVLNLWHEQCEIINGKISQRMNFKADEKHYSNIGKSNWAGRAKRMDNAIRTSTDRNIPIRVILLDGERKNAVDANSTPSKVIKRELDPEFWHVDSYNLDTGDIVICRGAQEANYEDQFSLPDYGSETPEKRETTGSAFVRDPKVRQWVLARAKGHCEFCGQKGFLTNRNTIYLETHHIISLADDGPDTVYNVIALCPNHHRQAHFGENREELRAEFVQILNANR
ncbi:MAG: HNH endonuclease [bacterium]